MARGGDRLFRVPDEPLRAPEGAGDVEAMIEVAEILGSLERLLERGARKPQRGRQPLELALVHAHASDGATAHGHMLGA